MDKNQGVKLPSYLPRRAEVSIAQALADTRVVVVVGARQAGKSTVVHAATHSVPGVLERRLDRPTEREAAHSDPVRFVDHEGLLVIDEVQRAPELLLPIKARVDEDQRPGQYVLTGSARLLGLRDVPDALVGRTETIELWPFSQGELDQLGGANSPTWIDRMFDNPIDFGAHQNLERSDYLQRACRGGFPEAVRREGGRRARFFDSYVNDLLDRDVTQLGDIQRRDELHRLLRLVADAMAQPLVTSRLGSALRLADATTTRYLGLFEEVFLVKQLPAWSASATTRASRAPKMLMVDTGLATHLSGRTEARINRDEALAGSVMENFVLSELARQVAWSTQRAWLGHFRTRDGIEVDGVLESPDGRIVGVEVKAARSVRADDFHGLRYLQDRTPSRFQHGVVLYAGDQVLPFGPDLTAIPISAIWN